MTGSEVVAKWNTLDPLSRNCWVGVAIMEWGVGHESWFDEEGVEGTRFTAPDGTEYSVFGHYAQGEPVTEEWDAIPKFTTDPTLAAEVAEAAGLPTPTGEFDPAELCLAAILKRGGQVE